MSNRVLNLLTCPFCEDDTGDIAVDAVAVDAHRREVEKSDELFINRDVDQRLLIFTTPEAHPGPCQHLLVMYGAIVWGPLDTEHNSVRCSWSLDYDWTHPVLLAKQTPDESIEEFVEWLEGKGIMPLPLRFRPSQQWKAEYLYRRWPDQPKKAGRYYQIDGRAVFVEDATAFCDQVLDLMAKHQRWLAETIS